MREKVVKGEEKLALQPYLRSDVKRSRARLRQSVGGDRGLAEATQRGTSAIVEAELNGFVIGLENLFNADCLTYVGPIISGVDEKIRDAAEALRRQSRRPRRLLFVLETSGGYAEVTRRISDTLRHHYRQIEFLVPSFAMSAGTILAMSGDAIWMDYFSVLGPIDPQIPNQGGGRFIPALGYLEKYAELLKKANAGTAAPAELQILLSFDQGDLYSYEQARNLSVALLEEWLAKYKFKNWKRTQKRRLKVTTRMKKDRAIEIARKLNNTNRWNSHGLGINMQTLRRELNIQIDDFGEDEEMSKAVRAYYGLLFDYLARLGQESVIHTRAQFEPLMWRMS